MGVRVREGRGRRKGIMIDGEFLLLSEGGVGSQGWARRGGEKGRRKG